MKLINFMKKIIIKVNIKEEISLKIEKNNQN